MHDFDNGWDSSAVIVDEHWVERSPRRAEVVPALRREAPLLGWLAPQLPLRVPVPVVVSEDPLRVRHRLIEGGPCDGKSAAQGKALGEFLRALHGADVATAVAMGVPPAAESHREHLAQLERFATEVVPRLPSDLRAPAESLLNSVRVPTPDACVSHGDLGPAHVLVQNPLGPPARGQQQHASRSGAGCP
ncbi:MAG TPA: phosphotransferase [Nocardioidaceae bacterium]|nr:phosphotransferase [Nocardioidaceae bacterium]